MQDDPKGQNQTDAKSHPSHSDKTSSQDHSNFSEHSKDWLKTGEVHSPSAKLTAFA